MFILEGKKHALNDKMAGRTAEDTKFYILKAPNEQFLQMGVKLNEWCISKKVVDKLRNLE